MNKVLVFDMDGTIADLYGVQGWLEKLRAYDASPYVEAKPIYDMDELNLILTTLKGLGWMIVVTSWLSKGSTPEYDKLVRVAKKDWLDKEEFPYDEIHLVKYGTTKANCTRKLGGFQIIVDDNTAVRNGWTLGGTIDAREDIISSLLALIENEVA